MAGKTLGIADSEPTFDALTVTGATKLDGNVALGNATADLVAFHGATAVDQGAAMTAAKPAFTIADAEGTPDEAIQAVTSTTPYGFVNAAELITFLYKVQNLHVRVGEIEQRLEEKGFIASN